eukprot:15465041-Alexandrium_andersonii.AAC.1
MTAGALPGRPAPHNAQSHGPARPQPGRWSSPLGSAMAADGTRAHPASLPASAAPLPSAGP